MPQTVSVRGWFRWLAFERAKAAHELFLAKRANPNMQLTPAQLELQMWAMLKDKT